MLNKLINAVTIIAAICTPVQAGLVHKQQTQDSRVLPTLSIDQVKICSALNGDVLLNVVAKLETGNMVSFTLPNSKIMIGEVTRVTVTDDNLTIVGKFFGEEEAGFGFRFERQGDISGAILLQKTREKFKLERKNNEYNFYLKRYILDS